MKPSPNGPKLAAMPRGYGRARLAEMAAWLVRHEPGLLAEGPDWRPRFIVFIGGRLLCFIALAWAGVYLALDHRPGALCMAELAGAGLVAQWMARRPRLPPAVLLIYLNLVLVLAGVCVFFDTTLGGVPRGTHLFFLPIALMVVQMFEGRLARFGHAIALLALLMFLVFSCTDARVITGHALPASVMRWGAPANALAGLLILILALLATHARVSERSLQLSELRRAVAERQFELHLQAQMGRNGAVVGAEGLMRWRHPRLGLLSPAGFIALAESSGLIVPLGTWGLIQGCKLLAAWQDDPRFADLRLAINVSAVQLQQPDFVATVEAVLARTGAPAGRLILELTESVHLADQPQIAERMRRLAGLGLGFSIDDFGTGYASLSYLQRLPLAQLKIDQSFVRALGPDARAHQVCKSLVALARRLRLSVTAEGVETELQLALLVAMGCDSFQGHLFSKPLLPGEFEALALRRHLRSAA